MLTAPPLIGRSHPGINFSRLEIGGDLGGLVMVVGSVAGLLIGLPAARLFFGAAMLGAVLVAVGLSACRRRRARLQAQLRLARLDS